MEHAVIRDDRFWNRLLKSIEEGQVVPVVGSQLLTCSEPDKPQTLQRAMAERLLEIREVDPSSVDLAPSRELHDAVPNPSRASPTSISRTSTATYPTPWTRCDRPGGFPGVRGEGQATRIADLLKDKKVPDVVTKYIGRFEGSNGIRPGQVEIWFAPNAFQ